MVKYFIADQRFMNEEGLHGVASSWVIRLGVHHNLDGFVEVAVLVKVGVADTISMTQHRDRLGSLLDGPHQLIGAPGYDEVNVVLQLEEVRHVVSAGDQRNSISAPVATQSLRHESHQGFIAMSRLLPALQSINEN